MRFLCGLSLLLVVLNASAWTEDDETRWRNLNLELRCLVCQNQSIADSHAPLAEDLRRQVREMMEAGKSDQDIRLYMTDRYGDYVLYRPAFKPLNWFLWFGPGLMLLLALGFVQWFRKRVVVPDAPANEQEIAALLKEVERD